MRLGGGSGRGRHEPPWHPHAAPRELGRPRFACLCAVAPARPPAHQARKRRRDEPDASCLGPFVPSATPHLLDRRRRPRTGRSPRCGGDKHHVSRRPRTPRGTGGGAVGAARLAADGAEPGCPLLPGPSAPSRGAARARGDGWKAVPWKLHVPASLQRRWGRPCLGLPAALCAWPGVGLIVCTTRAPVGPRSSAGTTPSGAPVGPGPSDGTTPGGISPQRRRARSPSAFLGASLLAAAHVDRLRHLRAVGHRLLAEPCWGPSCSLAGQVSGSSQLHCRRRRTGRRRCHLPARYPCDDTGRQGHGIARGARV